MPDRPATHTDSSTAVVCDYCSVRISGDIYTPAWTDEVFCSKQCRDRWRNQYNDPARFDR